MRSFLEVVSSSDSSDGESLDLTTLETVKAELGITSTDEDDLLSTRIARASRLIEEYCNRRFAVLDVVETFHPRKGMTPCEMALPLSQFPIVNIDSIEADGSAVASLDYELDARSGLLWRTSGWNWCGKIVATYSGGYSTVPASLESACIELMRDLRFTANSGAASGTSVRRVTHGTTSVEYSVSAQNTDASSGLPLNVVELLRPFRRISV